jgi:ketosteroid isomerase-like protein
VRGRAGAQAVFDGARSMGIRSVRLETDEVIPLGAEAACEIGHAVMVPEAGAELRVKYAVVWRRDAGEWRLAVDVWNSLPA